MVVVEVFFYIQKNSAAIVSVKIRVSSAPIRCPIGYPLALQQLISVG